MNFINKAINIFFGYPLYIISFFTKRDKKKIVVGSHTPFNDNSKYFFLLSDQYLKDYRIIWLTNSRSVEKKISSINKEVYRVRTLKGIYHALTAYIYIYSFHLIDINFWTSGRSIKFNLWHGIPLKDIAFMIKSGPSASIYNEKNLFSRFIRPHVFIRPNYMLTTSSSMTSYFAKAFRIKKEQCLEYGMTRCDIFSWDNDKIIEFIKQYESNDMLDLIKTFEAYDKVIIYMPTWREDIDFLYKADFDFNKLNDTLIRKNRLFLFKLHPFTKLKEINLTKLNDYSNIIVMDKEMDIYPVLPFTDFLISDYSSIYYDYLLLNKPVYLFPYDYDDYIVKSRTLAFDYNEKMPGEKIDSFENLLEVLVREQHYVTDKQKDIVKEYFTNLDGNSVELLSNFIKKELK
jgi:CDP-glycerol glycerophosphotransferase (TagB/SpsB family)